MPSPDLPAESVSSSAAVAVCFSNEKDCTAFAVNAIDAAENHILVNAYALTGGSEIVGALVRAKQRGSDTVSSFSLTPGNSTIRL